MQIGGFYIDKLPLYTCRVCEAKASVKNNGEGQEPTITYTCDHRQGVNANLAMRCIGEGHFGLGDRIEHAIKTKVGQGLTALLGRSVRWQ